MMKMKNNKEVLQCVSDQSKSEKFEKSILFLISYTVEEREKATTDRRSSIGESNLLNSLYNVVFHSSSSSGWAQKLTCLQLRQ